MPVGRASAWEQRRLPSLRYASPRSFTVTPGSVVPAPAAKKGRGLEGRRATLGVAGLSVELVELIHFGRQSWTMLPQHRICLMGVHRSGSGAILGRWKVRS